MDEKAKRKRGFYEEGPTTFEIHPEDVTVVFEEDSPEPFEAFQENVSKGLAILSEMKEAVLRDADQ